MNVNDVKCPTCAARVGKSCQTLYDGDRSTHVGRERLTRAVAVGQRLNFRRIGRGTYEAFDSGIMIGVVWTVDTYAKRWSCRLPDGTVVSRDSRHTRATTAAFLLDPVLPEMTP